MVKSGGLYQVSPAKPWDLALYSQRHVFGFEYAGGPKAINSGAGGMLKRSLSMEKSRVRS